MALFIILVVASGSRPAQTQVAQWSPTENFQSRVNRLETSLESGGDSYTYYAIFKHLLSHKPKQSKDQLVCLLKTFSFTDKWVLEPPFNFYFNLLANWGKEYSNAEEPGYAACQVDDEFRDKFEEKFEGLDIERVLAGEQMPKLLMILLERSKSVVAGTDSYHSLKVLLLFLNNFVKSPGLDSSRIRLEKPNPMMTDILLKQPQSLHSLYQMTNWWNRCEVDNNFVVRHLKEFKLLAEGGKEYVDLYSMSHHFSFPDTLQWKEVPQAQGHDLPEQTLPPETVQLAEQPVSDGNSLEPVSSQIHQMSNEAAADSNIQSPPLPSRYSCDSSCFENLSSLAKVLIALGENLEGRVR